VQFQRQLRHTLGRTGTRALLAPDSTHFTYRFGGRPAAFENQIDWILGTALAGATRGGQFPVDITEDKDNTFVRAELPGVNRDAISVEVIDGSVSIKASRKAKSGEGEVAVSRLVSIPDAVQADKVSAAYENGILTVTLPRKEEAKPRKINVSVN
jgi:HSP20 family protein